VSEGNTMRLPHSPLDNPWVGALVIALGVVMPILVMWFIVMDLPG